MTATQLTSRYRTIATVGYRGSVSRDENRAAHGGVCHLQAMTRGGVTYGRKVNANGRHREVGAAEVIDAETLAHWQTLAR